jgi:transcriptional regulator with XRE-family HTH domain
MIPCERVWLLWRGPRERSPCKSSTAREPAIVKKTPDLIDRHVGTRVRMRRMLLKMSQEKLGEALGLTFQQIQKYEKGLNRIGASRLQQISKTLNVPPAFFFEGAPTGVVATADGPAGFEEEGQSQYVVDFMSTAEGLHLNRSFARIRNPKVRRRLVELIATLADADAGADEAPGKEV